MMAARFHVFSGTGNSLHLARRLAACLGPAGIGAEILEVAKAEPPWGAAPQRPAVQARLEGDLDLFVFPVYAMAVPRIMSRYMKRLGKALPLPGGGKPRAAVLSTNGRISARFRDGHEGQALAQAERILGRLGWEVVYRETFDYPQNITSFIPIQGEARRAAILDLALPKVEAAAAELAAGTVKKRLCRPVFHLIGWPFGWLYRILGRRAFGMLFAADGRCDGCGACAKHCPAKAIRMIRGRPDWSYACEGCERCINLCPKKAIQTSALRVALMASLFIFADACPIKPLFLSLAATASLPGWLTMGAWLVIELVLAFVLFRALDLALFALAFLPGFRPVLAFGWTKWFRRYKAPALPLAQAGSPKEHA